MSGPVQRQPWFWAVLTAVAALFIFSMVIVAANRSDNGRDSTTVVQQPSPTDQPEFVPVPAPQASAPTQPASPPAPPAPPAAPPVVRERTIIIREDKGDKKRAETRREERSGRDTGTVPDPEVSGSRVLEIKEFRSTGLPMEIRFEDGGWKAAEERTVAEPTTELKSIGMTEDDAEVWVPVHAVEPFDRIYVAVLDEEGKYVVYRRK